MEIAIAVLFLVSGVLGYLVLMSWEENAALHRDLDALNIKLDAIRRLAAKDDDEE